MSCGNPVYIVGNTHSFQLNAMKDCVLWQFGGGAVVTLDFVRPDGSVFTVTATITNAPLGQAQFTTAPNPNPTLNMSGMWERYWHVVDGAADMRFGPIRFDVLDEVS